MTIPSQHPFCTAWPAANPALLQQQLKFLLMRYARTPARSVGGEIVTCLENLLMHPDFTASLTERCVYRRMLMEWRARAL